MSILIKGMEMPKNCMVCNFGVGGTCVAMGQIRTRDWRAEKTSEHCPLISIPPHGDLIDRDALCAKADDTIVHSDPVNLVIELGTAFKYYLKNAPTIIEAEVEDD